MKIKRYIKIDEEWIGLSVKIRLPREIRKMKIAYKIFGRNI
jgi:hypothetical protein